MKNNQKTHPVVLVTGGSRGLGRGVVLKLAEQGYSVAINYASNSDAAKETVSECRKLASSAAQQFFPVKADISSADEREAMVSAILSEMGRKEITAPYVGIAPFGTRIALYAHEETRWMAVCNANDCEDLKDTENKIKVADYSGFTYPWDLLKDKGEKL